MLQDQCPAQPDHHHSAPTRAPIKRVTAAAAQCDHSCGCFLIPSDQECEEMAARLRLQRAYTERSVCWQCPRGAQLTAGALRLNPAVVLVVLSGGQWFPRLDQEIGS
jgi:hypothetical protein